MPFRPNVGDTLIIENNVYRVAEHPAAPGMAYGQEGRQATVYKLLSDDGSAWALKVFKPRFRAPAMVSLAERLKPYARMVGLAACRHTILAPQRDGELLGANPDLTYAVVMPWIEGPTWMEVMLRAREMSAAESLTLARGLAELLANLEQQGGAHCDLSASNLLLPLLAGGEGLQLVDVEQMYGPDLRRPTTLPAGSPGYAHRSAPEGLWSAEADRFAGAVLLAEILGWCDDRVRRDAWGESYFDPQEMQVDGYRAQMLGRVLREWWGERVAGLLQRAWSSETLADCATFGEWVVLLAGRTVGQAAAPQRAERGAQAGAPEWSATEQAQGPEVTAPREVDGSVSEGPEAAEDGVAEPAEAEADEEGAMAASGQAPTADGVMDETRAAGEQAVAWAMMDILPEGAEDTAAEQQWAETLAQGEADERETATWREEEEAAGGRSGVQGRGGTRLASRVLLIGALLVVGVIMVGLLRRGFFGLAVPAETPVASVQTVTMATTPGASEVAASGPESIGTLQFIMPTAAPTTAPAQGVSGGAVILPENVNRLRYEEIHVRLAWVEAMAFSPDGSALAIGGGDSFTVYDVAGQYLYVPFGDASVYTAQFSADGTLVTAGEDPGGGRVRAWDLSAHKLVWSLAADASQAGVGAAIRQDGAWLATREAGELRLWRIYRDGPRAYSSLGQASGQPAFSPNGRWLGCPRDDGVGIWDISDSTMLRLNSPGASEYGPFVAFSVDSIFFAACGADGVTRIWERGADGWRLRTFTDSVARGYGIAFSPSGHILAVGYENGTARIFDTKDGSELAELPGMSGRVSVAFSPDGRVLAAGSGNGVMRLYRVNG